MNIQERLVRQNPEDIIFVGDVVERHYNSDFGHIIRAFINAKITEALTEHQVNPPDREPMSSDRIMGRCEGYTNVTLGLEQMIEDKNVLTKVQRENMKGDDRQEEIG